MISIKSLSNKSRYIPPKINVVPFSQLHLGRRINSGIQSSVYNIKGFDSLVVKTNSFKPEELKWDVNPFTYQLMSCPEGRSVVMERAVGKPLFGKDWQMTVPPMVTYYKYYLRKILAIPDEAFADYMKKVVFLRKNGYEVDYVNPNNILYDKKNKKFNIVDLGKCEPKISKELDVRYLGAFWDDVRLLNIYDNANFISKIEIAHLVKKIMNKVCRIGKENGFKIEIDPPDKYSYQRPSTCFFNNQRKRIDECLKNPYFREVYLIRLDD